MLILLTPSEKKKSIDNMEFQNPARQLLGF